MQNIKMQMLFSEDPACEMLVGTKIPEVIAPQVAAISLGHKSRSPEDIRAEQLKDVNIEPVIKWMENSEKPFWEVIAPYRVCTVPACLNVHACVC